jgi:RNA polymerase sigma factor (sigma-70 family)
MRDLLAIVRHLKHVLRRHGRNDQEADDLIQDAFLRLECYRKAHEVEHDEAFLVRTVVNLSIDAHRTSLTRPATETLVEETVVIDATPRPDEVCLARERLERLSAGLDAMSPKTREIFLAHRLEGLGQSEIARRHGVTLSAVEKHIAKAVLYLTEWMDDDE